MLTVSHEERSQEDIAYNVLLCSKNAVEERRARIRDGVRIGGMCVAEEFGYRGELYYMTGDCTVSKPAARSFAIGTGGDLAFGAFHALLRTSVGTDRAMIQSLEIAAEFNLSVAPPFYVLTL